LVTADGAVFPFGSVQQFGSMSGRPLRNLIAGIVPTPTFHGYWLWGQDGSVFPFGDATDLGDYHRLSANQQVLPSEGIDAFYGMSVRGAAGYTLWAVSGLRAPPSVTRFDFAPPPPPSPVPTISVPPLLGL
jgi:hypothetical protein